MGAKCVVCVYVTVCLYNFLHKVTCTNTSYEDILVKKKKILEIIFSVQTLHN